MDFEPSERCSEFRERLTAFMDEHVYPAEEVYELQLRESGNPHHQPAVMEELKERAREAGLWNMFLPDAEHGAGLSNSDYAPLAEILGRSHIASEACNCSAPDTGNMEVLNQFATPEQKERWLMPLLDGEIRSAFAMTEPDVASSDATNIALRIERDGNDYVLNGRKWWTSNALHPNCRIMIVMGKTQPDAPVHKQQSMILVPLDTPGVTLLRGLSVFGYQDQEGHAEVDFSDVRVPASNLIAGEGDGFMIAQARLGPGRIHHCMRALGAAERALESMCRRAITPRDVRPADRDARQHPGLDRGVPHRNRDGATADSEGGLDDGHGRQPPGSHGDRGDQGRRTERRPEGPLTARSRCTAAAASRKTSRSPGHMRTCARCDWPTGPTRSTSCRSRAASSRPTSPGSSSCTAAAARSADTAAPIRASPPAFRLLATSADIAK